MLAPLISVYGTLALIHEELQTEFYCSLVEVLSQYWPERSAAYKTCLMEMLSLRN